MSPRFVQLTPPGRGAVATVLVEGHGASRAVEAHFHAKSGRTLSDHAADQIVFGRFGSTPGEQVVVHRRSDESVELHCHGGRAAVAMIENSLTKEGCRPVAWQNWVDSRHDDPITAAAHAALAEARTERAAAILLDQYHGALRRVMDKIERSIRNAKPQAARELTATLLSRADVGLHLTRPWQVVLCGRSNVGKSSLINALAGYQRVIVHPTPGTTRDVVSVHTAADGWPVELSDTAGLHAGSDTFHRASIELAERKLAQADLVVLVFDLSVPWSKDDRELISSWPGAVVVHNKSDLPGASGAREPSIAISVLLGHGLEELTAAIADGLVPDPPPPGTAVPFTEEQVEWLHWVL